MSNFNHLKTLLQVKRFKVLQNDPQTKIKQTKKQNSFKFRKQSFIKKQEKLRLSVCRQICIKAKPLQ